MNQGIGCWQKPNKILAPLEGRITLSPSLADSGSSEHTEHFSSYLHSATARRHVRVYLFPDEAKLTKSDQLLAKLGLSTPSIR